MNKRIALLGIYHESNTFVPEPTTLENFHGGRYLKGQDIVKEYREAHHEIGGMIEIVDKENMELVPVFYAEATPGGTITSETYEALFEDMMKELDRVLPVDAVLVVPHGAGVSESFPDMDGHWLNQIRNKVGADIPIVGTLDLHANVSQGMVSSTDALVSYRENPHIDQRQRGKEAANLMVRKLRQEIELSQVLVQAPLAISIEQQLTADEPCKSLYLYARELTQQENILSISIQLGFPYADVNEMGTSIIVVTDGNLELANVTARELEVYLIENKEHFIGIKVDVPSALQEIEVSEKPVLLLDMGDNIGGGSPGNNLCILEALEESKEHRYFVCIYDPQAVSYLGEHNIGDFIKIDITGVDGDGTTNLPVRVKLQQISEEGTFKEDHPRHGGQVNYRMGKTAIVSTENRSTIMLTSLRTVPFSLQQLLAFDIAPQDFDVIVAKGVNAPIAAYAPVCPTIIQVNTPGVTQADMTMFEYRNRRRPLFPFEDI